MSSRSFLPLWITEVSLSLSGRHLAAYGNIIGPCPQELEPRVKISVADLGYNKPNFFRVRQLFQNTPGGAGDGRQYQDPDNQAPYLRGSDHQLFLHIPVRPLSLLLQSPLGTALYRCGYGPAKSGKDQGPGV
jgi:hypothetical protein